MPDAAEYLRLLARLGTSYNPYVIAPRLAYEHVLEPLGRVQERVGQGFRRRVMGRPEFEPEEFAPGAETSVLGAVGRSLASGMGSALMGGATTVPEMLLGGAAPFSPRAQDLLQRLRAFQANEGSNPVNIALAAAEPLALAGRAAQSTRYARWLPKAATAARQAVERVPYIGKAFQATRRALTVGGELEDWPSVRQGFLQMKGSQALAQHDATWISNRWDAFAKASPDPAAAAKALYDVAEGRAPLTAIYNWPGVAEPVRRQAVRAIAFHRTLAREAYPRLTERYTGIAVPASRFTGRYLGHYLEGAEPDINAIGEIMSRANLAKGKHAERLLYRTGAAATDPRFLTAKKPWEAARRDIAKQYGDLARLDFARVIRDDPTAAKPLDLSGLTGAARRAEINMFQMLNPDFVEMPKLSGLKLTKAKRAKIRAMGGKLPPAYGPLAGYGPNERVFVHKKLKPLIEGIWNPEKETEWHRWGSNIMKLWKSSVTLLNPAGQLRNVGTDVFFLDGIGVPIQSPTSTVLGIKYGREMIDPGNPLIREAIRNNVIGGDYASTFIARHFLPTLEQSAGKPGGLLAASNRWMEKVLQSRPMDIAGTAWRVPDDFTKYTAWRYLLDRGVSGPEATQMVLARMPAYNLSPSLLAKIEESPFGRPFVQWPYHTARILKNMALSPQGQMKLLEWAAAGYLMKVGAEEGMRGKLTPQQIDALGYRPKSLNIPMPIKPDEKGRPRFVDATNLIPIGDPLVFLRDAVTPGQTAETLWEGVATHPLLQWTMEMALNKSRFTGRPISTPERAAGPLGTVGAYGAYTAKSLLPPVLMRSLPRAAAGLAEAAGAPEAAKEVRWHADVSPRSEGAAAGLLGAAGFRTEPGDLRMARLGAIASFRQDEEDIRRGITRLARRYEAKEMTQADYAAARARLVARLRARMVETRERLAALRGPSGRPGG